MAAKLSNDELAARVRNRMQRASAKYRERKVQSGRTQTLVWLPDTIRAQLDSLVEQRNESLSAVTTDLLSAALTGEPITTTPTNQAALLSPATTTPADIPATPPTVDYSREARKARRRRVVEVCGDAVRSGASTKEIAAIIEAHGVKSEDGTAMLVQTARLWVRQADATKEG